VDFSNELSEESSRAGAAKISGANFCVPSLVEKDTYERTRYHISMLGLNPVSGLNRTSRRHWAWSALVFHTYQYHKDTKN